MTATERIEHLLERMPQKLSALQISKITKIPYNTVASALLSLIQGNSIERKMFYSAHSGNVCWHYWKGRGRP